MVRTCQAINDNTTMVLIWERGRGGEECPFHFQLHYSTTQPDHPLPSVALVPVKVIMHCLGDPYDFSLYRAELCYPSNPVYRPGIFCAEGFNEFVVFFLCVLYGR